MIEHTNDLTARATAIQCVIFDVDGVLSDGKLFFDLKGNEYKSFHAQDGQGLKLLQQNGIEVAVISGRKSPIVERRLHQLGIQHVFQGQENKVAAFEAILQSLNLNSENVAHVGDDLPDLALFSRVGLAFAVQNANPSVVKYCHAQTERDGGHGAAREVCDFLLTVQNKLTDIETQFAKG